MRVYLNTDKTVFICDVDTADENMLARKAGFVHNPLQRRLESARLKVAAALRPHHNQEVRDLFTKISCEVHEPWSGGILLPPGKALDPVQRLGVRDALERNHFYIAFDTGVGKTPTAVAIMNTLREQTIVLMPPHLIAQWAYEINDWKVGDVRVGSTRIPMEHGDETDILLVPDTSLENPEMFEWLKSMPHQHLIVEEAQRFVNWEAKRTERMFGKMDTLVPNGLVHKFEKTTFLSGTPMPNRPMELFPILSRQAANVIEYRNYLEYGIKYCNGHEGRFGWDFRGSSNWPELRKKMHGMFMRRAEKDEKFTKKIRRVIKLSLGKTLTEDYDKVALKGRTIQQFIGDFEFDPEGTQKLGEIVKYRKNLMDEKIPLVFNWVHTILRTSSEKVLLLGWHTGAINTLARLFAKYDPVVIHGQIPYAKRNEGLKRLKEGKTRLVIANVQTMVGYNMDQIHRVVFGEYSWTPKDNVQAENRPHRRTTKHNVRIDYLVMQDTLDEYVLETLLKKQKTINNLIAKHPIGERRNT